jgi:preprotein translocase subunit SecG
MLKTVVLIVQIICAIGLIATVLLQSGKSAGLSGSIAGGGEAILPV